MYGEKACALIRELDRNSSTLPPYNTELVSEISKEIISLMEHNQIDMQLIQNSHSSEGISYVPKSRVQHAAIQRNLRCFLAYHYNRIRCLRTMRWEFGSILPLDIKANLNLQESNWFSKYSSILAKYMRSVGKEGGLNLAVDLNPPKGLYIEVKCLVDYGCHELSDGSILLLKKNSRHCLPRVECEDLIRRGVFQHIVN